MLGRRLTMTSQPAGVAIACTDEQAQLGEGVRWDARRSELLRVDIVRGTVFRDRVLGDGGLAAVGRHELPSPVGTIAPIDGDDGWLLGAGRGFVHLAPDGRHRTITEVSGPGTRMNDGAADPQGRFWAGSLADDHHAGGGAFYCLDLTGHAEQVLDGLTIPNGVGWSPDGRTMYLVDSGPRVVHAFAFDADRGTIADERVLLTVPEDVGAPDGLTVDAAGDLWIAIFGAGQVRRYAPDGELRETLDVPAAQTTCCAFAGAGLHTLYVTTATEDWTDEQRAADPAAGLVYRLETGATGVAAASFRPDPAWWSEFTR
jgi:sugar lactone lactonase YvrE